MPPRSHRFRLVLNIVKWSVIATAVVLAAVAANHVDVIDGAPSLLLFRHACGARHRTARPPAMTAGR